MKANQSVSAMAKATGMTMRDVKRMLAQVRVLVEHCARQREDFVLPGLGKFTCQEKHDGTYSLRFRIPKSLRLDVFNEHDIGGVNEKLLDGGSVNGGLQDVSDPQKARMRGAKGPI